MLVEDAPLAELVGYLSADSQSPGFVVPLFRRRNSNMLLVQCVDAKGRVRDFREVLPRQMEPVTSDKPWLQGLDKPALWGFRDKNGEAFFADRETLKETLFQISEDIEQPFLKLQVAQFCDDDTGLIEAWQTAFHHLSERSPRSAHAWRDVVIIPAHMRLAVEQAIIAHGMTAAIEQLDRTVEVDVDQGKVRLHLEDELHAAFAADPAARRTLERGTVSIRKAFSLSPGPVVLIPKRSRTGSAGHDPAIEAREGLLAIFSESEKPPRDWRIAIQHEKLVYRRSDHRAVSYDEPGGLRDLLVALTEFGWNAVEESGNIIALTGIDGNIGLEPGGQLQLSGAALENLHQICAESSRHRAQLKAAGEKLGLGFLGLGMWPDKTRDELPRLPKARHAIMLRHMPRVGSLGLDMMLRTCAIQVDLDYGSETDMAQKFRVALALQPLAVALFANSPFTDGGPNGFLSFRSHIWSDTDPARTGMLPFVFEQGFSYDRYVDYALDVPMYFVYREGRYIDAAGQSFRDFLKGQLPALPGEKPRLSDWTDHLSVAYPEVRLKRSMELRGADGGHQIHVCALAALWAGLLYDQSALEAIWDDVKSWSLNERQRLRDEVPRLALKALTPSRESLRDFAGRVLDIAETGLRARARLSTTGTDEAAFLEPLRETVARGTSPAEALLERYHGDWGGDVKRVYEEDELLSTLHTDH